MSEGKGPPETVVDRVKRWQKIAEDHAQRAEAYRLYPGDWASLAGVLRDALAALPKS